MDADHYASPPGERVSSSWRSVYKVDIGLRPRTVIYCTCRRRCRFLIGIKLGTEEIDSIGYHVLKA